VSEKSEKNPKKSDALKSLTVEDLAQVVGGDGEDGTLKYGGEIRGPQRESRYPPYPPITGEPPATED
jgi:hypothetical protein